MSGHDELTSLRETVRRVSSGEESAESVAGKAIRRLDDAAAVHAVTHPLRDRALQTARALDLKRARGEPLGPLAGVPYVAKDNIDTVGAPTTGGANILRDNRPSADAAIIRQIEAAGGVLLGKANMHELAFGGTTTNPSYGTTRNPFSRAHVPGGSSGGSAAAVGAGIVPLALGTDTAASVRVPASCCGIVGLRPTVLDRDRKKYAETGLLPCSKTLDAIGPMARSVADIQYLHSVIAQGEAPQDVGVGPVRLGLPSAYFLEDLEDEVQVVFDAAIDGFRQSGVEIVEVDFGDTIDQAVQGFDLLLADAVGNGWREEFDPKRYGFGFDDVLADSRAPDVRYFLEFLVANTPSPALAADMEKRREAIRAAYVSVLSAHGLSGILFPTTPILPMAIREEGDLADARLVIRGKEMSVIPMMIRNTKVGSFLGAPGLSLPIGLAPTSKLPVGLEIDGIPGQDQAVLAVGRVLEDIIGAAPLPARWW